MISSSELWAIVQFYAPLGVIGTFRWGVWAVKRISGRYYKSVPLNGYTDTVSVVIPVYREEPDIFRLHLQSIAKNKPHEIVAVIDDRDVACKEVAHSLEQEIPFLRILITTTPGKRPALRDGFRSSTGNIIAFVDSDTIWPENTLPPLLAPFIDPLVGGVGCRQQVYKDDTFSRKIFNIQLESRYNQEFHFLGAVGDAFTCLSGRTALYRRSILNTVIDNMVNEHFAGLQCVGGDDKCLTRLIQERDWKARYQDTAVVYTSGAPSLKTLIKQETRWLRNTWRSDLQSIRGAWIWHREKPLAFHMIDRFIDPPIALLSPVYLVVTLCLQNWLAAGILVCWWLVSRGIKVLTALRRHPKYLPLLPVYILFEHFMNLVKMYAFFTMNVQGWMTRGKEKEKRFSIARIAAVVSPFVAVGLIIAFITSLVAFYANLWGI